MRSLPSAGLPEEMTRAGHRHAHPAAPAPMPRRLYRFDRRLYLAGGLISSKCVDRPAARPGYTHEPTNLGLATTSLANQNIGMSANSSNRWSPIERASFCQSWGFVAPVRAM